MESASQGMHSAVVVEMAERALLPGKKVILLAVAVTKVKCIYCCKFFTSWYHFMDNNNKS
jgi:hypothetical protein